MIRLRKADIVLASPRTLVLSPGALVYRLLLRVRYVHSMLYLGGGRMIHTTTKDGVVVARLPRKLHKKERYVILRAPDISSERRQKIVEKALEFRGSKMDHAGLMSNVPARLFGLKKPLIRMEKNRLWCSKLIYSAYLAADVELVPAAKAKVITSDDLIKSPRLRTIK